MYEIDKLDKNVAQACADLTRVKEAIEDKGVEVPDGTPTSGLPLCVNDVYEAGKTDFGYRKSVSGSYLYIDDVHQNEKAMSIVVASKNSFNVNGSLTDKIGWTTGTTVLEDGKIKATADYKNGYGTGQFIEVLPNTTYTLSYAVDSMETSGTSAVALYLLNADNKLTLVKVQYSTTTGYPPHIIFTTLEDTKRVWLSFCGVAADSGEVTNGKYYAIYDKVQLEQGTTGTAYTPYVDISTATINVCNRNLVPFPYRTTNYDNNGITAVMQDDGGILLNGTSTAEIYLSLYVGTLFYTTLAVWNTADDFTNSQWLNGAMYVNYDYNTKTTFLYIPSGKTFNNMLVYPQIVLGTELGEFEKGVMQTYTPTADGKIEIDVIHPNMSILPTVRGVTINAEYYADCEKSVQDGKEAVLKGYTGDYTRTNFNYALSQADLSGFAFEETVKPTDIYCMFQYYKGEYIPSGLDLSNVPISTSSGQWLCRYASKLKVFPDINYPAQTRYASTWEGCTELETVEVVRSAENSIYITPFEGCKNLKNIAFEGVIGQNIDFQHCSVLSKASILNIFEHLSNTATGMTVKFSLQAIINAFGDVQAQEWKDLIATKTNWTFSLV